MGAPGAEWFWVTVRAGETAGWRWDAGEEGFVRLLDGQAERAEEETRGKRGRYVQPGGEKEWRKRTSRVGEKQTASARRVPEMERRRGHDRTGELRRVEEPMGWMEALFVEFALGEEGASFEAWRDLVELMCGCVDGPRENPELFADICELLAWQLEQAGIDVFFQDTGRNRLALAVQQMTADLLTDAELEHGRLKESARKLASLVPGLGDEGEEDDEDKPMIVE